MVKHAVSIALLVFPISPTTETILRRQECLKWSDILYKTLILEEVSLKAVIYIAPFTRL